MTEYRSVLERARSNFPIPDLSLDGVLLRRERKQRNQRLAAGIVGLLIAIAAAAGGAALLRSAPLPADDQQPSLPPILREGEVLNGFVAIDQDTGDRRRLAHIGCKDPNDDCNVVLFRSAMSADGRWLAYELATCTYVGPCDPQGGVWVTNALGEQRQVTEPCDPEGPCFDWTWAWSSRGAALAVYDGPDAQLFTLDPLSEDPVSILESVDPMSALAWSPDGTSIAYAATGLHVVDLGSGDSTMLTDLVGDVDNIAWSPEGTQLVLDDVLGGLYRIVVVDADGSDPRVLVEQADQARPSAPPAWSPDGTRIAYISTDREVEVWVIRADGSDATRLFHAECCSGRPEDGPVWAPDGSRIAFMYWNPEPPHFSWLVVNTDGTGSSEQIDELEFQAWRTGG